MNVIQEGDVLIFEDGTELKADLVENFPHDGHVTQYVEGTSGNRRTYTYINDGLANSEQGVNGRIIKCLRP